MCIAQDRRNAAGPKAVSVHPPAKMTLESLLRRSAEMKVSDDATATTATTAGETVPTLQTHDCSSSQVEDVDFELAASFEQDLAFLDVPTDGIICLPRHHEETTVVNHASPACASASLSPNMTESSQSQEALHRPGLFIEVLKPAPFPSEGYRTPTTAHCHNNHSKLSPPATPRHKCRLHVMSFDSWPESLYMPTLS